MARQPSKPHPPDGREKVRTFRVKDELWDQAMRAAAENDENLSQVLRRSLRKYVAKTKRRAGAG